MPALSESRLAIAHDSDDFLSKLPDGRCVNLITQTLWFFCHHVQCRLRMNAGRQVALWSAQ